MSNAKQLSKISHNTKCFFQYSFIGDGKYYTTEQGSKSYKNTSFKNFYNQNSFLIDIIEKGNDALKGGQTGNFVIVKFNEDFYIKWQWYIDHLSNEIKRSKLVQETKQYCKNLKVSFWEGDKSLFNEAIAKYPECNVIGDCKKTVENIYSLLTK